MNLFLYWTAASMLTPEARVCIYHGLSVPNYLFVNITSSQGVTSLPPKVSHHYRPRCHITIAQGITSLPPKVSHNYHPKCHITVAQGVTSLPPKVAHHYRPRCHITTAQSVTSLSPKVSYHNHCYHLRWPDFLVSESLDVFRGMWEDNSMTGKAGQHL